MSKKLRIAFMGTPDFAVPALQTLLNSEHDVVCVYSQPPRPKGRGQKLQLSPVHQLAESAEVLVRTPKNFKDKNDVQDFDALNLDIAIVAAYGLILPKEILEAPQYGCVNIHASLLPRWRGAAPIHRAILAGDTQTGITLMKMDEGLDTGDMIAKDTAPITDKTTLPALHDELAAMGGEMLLSFIQSLADTETIEAEKQPDEGVTYASMLSKEEGHIDWSDSAEDIERRIRAFNPWPGTWCLKADQSRLKIIEASIAKESYNNAGAGTILENGRITCGNSGVLELIKIQPANKKAMDIQSALNGGYIKSGDVLS